MPPVALPTSPAPAVAPKRSAWMSPTRRHSNAFPPPSSSGTGGDAADVETTRRTHYRGKLGGWSDGQRRPDQLRGIEGRSDRVRQGARARSGVARHHGERDRAGHDRYGDDA